MWDIAFSTPTLPVWLLHQLLCLGALHHTVIRPCKHAPQVRIMCDGLIQTLGRVTFGGKLDHPFTAHPKIDPKTGEGMRAFGYGGPSELALCAWTCFPGCSTCVR